MRFLHTADWHLGRLFYGTHLTEEQAYVLEQQFFPLLKEEKIDAIVLAGDVFDRAVPPEEAVRLWDDVVTMLAKEIRIPMIVIGGNHDSGERLQYGRALFQSHQIYMEGTVQVATKPIVLTDAHGPISFCPMPFAAPHEVSMALDLGRGISFHKAYQAWLEQQVMTIPKGQRKVAIAHAFVTGGKTSESVRPLVVGGHEEVGRHIFDGFQYTALGHLHGPQTWMPGAESAMGQGPIHYSGSLLKYSFDEAKQKKQFTIVDMDASGDVAMTAVPIVPRRDVRVIRGYFEDVMDGAVVKKQQELGQSLEDYIMVELLDSVPIIDAMARLRQRYPNALAIDPIGRREVEDIGEEPQFKKVTHRELFAQFAEFVWKEPLTKEQRAYADAVWQEVLEEI